MHYTQLFDVKFVLKKEKKQKVFACNIHSGLLVIRLYVQVILIVYVQHLLR